MTPKHFLYCLLYVILREFVGHHYNGVVRQIMKLFLMDIASVIREVVGLKED